MDFLISVLVILGLLLNGQFIKKVLISFINVLNVETSLNAQLIGKQFKRIK
jgi:hypothetical protein